jgi:glycosyltransferase involved in cell wall biosynthesis
VNILFITQSVVNPLSGGVQRVTYTLGEEFERRGHSVFFLAVGSENWSSDNGPRQMVLPNRAALSDKGNSDFFNDLIRKKNIHFIINQVGIFPEVNNFLRSCDLGNARLIAVHHNCVKCLNVRYREIVLGNRRNSQLLKSIDFPIVWRLLRVLNRIKYGNYFRRAALCSDKLVLLSQLYIPELQYFGVNIPRNKVTSIGNPLSFEPDHSANEKQNRIIFVGRLSLTQKRVDKLLQIWSVLHQEFTHWEFDIVGDGSERKWMEAYAATHSLDRIHFHGDRPTSFSEASQILDYDLRLRGTPNGIG